MSQNSPNHPDSHEAACAPAEEVLADNNGRTADGDSTNHRLSATWTRLKKQQYEINLRRGKLEQLRRKLEQHVRTQNDRFAERRRELDTQLLENQRERVYLNDVKQHLKSGLQEFTSDADKLKAERDKLLERERTLRLNERQIQKKIVLVQQDYEARIDSILQEKNEVEQRVFELQRQVNEWHEQHSVQEQSLRTAPRTPSWRLAAALLAAALTAAAVLLATAFHYQMSMGVNADRSRLDAAQIEQHRQGLANAVSQTYADGSAALLSCSASPGGPDTPAPIQLNAVADDIVQARIWLEEVVDNYLQNDQDNRKKIIAENRKRIDKLEADIAIARAEYNNVLQKRDDKRLAIQIENPRKELERLEEQLAETRKHFEQSRQRIKEDRAQLFALQQIDVPETPLIDDATRRQAERLDNYLLEDAKALTVRLGQLRQLLLDACENSIVAIRKLNSAGSDLSAFIHDQKLQVDDRRVAAGLDELADRADQLNQLIHEFKTKWTHLSDNLQSVSIDTRRKDFLELQLAFEDLIKRFDLDWQEKVDALQMEYHDFRLALDSPAAYFNLRNGLINQINLLAHARQGLTTRSGQLIRSQNFRLDAAMDSAIGLTRRVRDRRRGIERELITTRRQQLEEDLELRIQQQKQLIKDHEAAHEKTLAKILDVQDQFSALLPYLAEHGATTTVVRYDQERLDTINTRLKALGSEKQSLLSEIEQLAHLDGALNRERITVASWPVNTVERMSKVGFGGLLALLVSYQLLGIGSAGRRQAGSK